MICKKCGTQLDDNAVYCYNCGYIFEKPREPQPGANFAPPVNIQPIGQPKKKASIWYTVIIPITAVLVVIAIVSGLYVGGVFNGGNSWQIEVPDVVGKAYDKASTTLEKKNLHCLISDKVENADVDENNVLSQDPSAKTVAGKGSIVDVVLSAGAGKIYMPDIENYSKDYAKDILTAQGFEVEFRDAKGDCEKFAPDSVCDYSLENGQGTYKGETVIVYVKPEEEKQTAKYSMPKIVGMDFDDAQDKLYSDGIYISIEKYEYNDRIPENQIVAQSVNENEQVDKDSTVYVTISLGKEKVFMPDVAFTTEENAKKILEECGLKVKIEEEENQYVAKGTVIEQKDTPGTQIEKGTEVTIIVSSGYAVTVPDVVGLNEKEAISRIIESGLAVNVVYEYDVNKAQKTVTAQDKQANEKVQLGTVLTIVVNDKKRGEGVSKWATEISEETVTIVQSEVTTAEIATTSATTTTTSATTKATTNSNKGWVEAYKKYLKDGNVKPFYNDKAWFVLDYIDGDDIPELICGEGHINGCRAKIFTYKNSQLNEVGWIGDRYCYFEYKPRSGIIVESLTAGNAGIVTFRVRKFNGTKFEEIWEGTDATESIAGNGKLYIGEKEVSQAQFEAEKAKYVPSGLTRGTDVEHEITNTNIEKYIK